MRTSSVNATKDQEMINYSPSLARRHTLSDILRRTAKRFPEKPAVICGETSWTYRQFDEVCSRLAAGLAACGVRVSDRIAIASRNSHAFAAVRFAVARVGAVLVPINCMLTVPEIRYILEHSGASLLCVDSGMAEIGASACAGTAVKSLLWLPGEERSSPIDGFLNFDTLAKSSATLHDGGIDSDAVAQIIYTSGTEARPKGTLLTHAAVLWEYVTCIADVEILESDCILHALPLFHCAQLDIYLGPGVYVGATNVITGKPTADNILMLLARHGITSFFAPPTVWISLLRSSKFDTTDLAALRKGYYGASIMPIAVLKEMHARLPGVRFWNLYGQTEIAPVATVLKPEDQLRKAGSAGKAALNVETRVVDEDMCDVPEGTVGEVIHRSPQLTSGYFNDDEKTREAFRGGWFHSGDLGVIDADGYLTIVDRKKDMIKTGGENVASREVEEALYQIAEISEVAVIGTPDSRWIEAVTAIIVRKAGSELTEDQVIEHVRGRLASFKTPKKVHFVDSLPKTPSGKILKRELRLRYG